MFRLKDFSSLFLELIYSGVQYHGAPSVKCSVNDVTVKKQVIVEIPVYQTVVVYHQQYVPGIHTGRNPHKNFMQW